MAGYAKSVIFPSSSTLPEVVIAAFGGNRPEYAYKLYVLISAAAVPWLMALAGVLWRVPARGVAIAVLVDLLYLWTDFPINYAAVGMLPYFLAIPAGLAATGAFSRFLTARGVFAWLLSVGLLSASFLVHFTAAMIIVPAAALAYLAGAPGGSRLPTGAGRRANRRSSGSSGFGLPPKKSTGFHLAAWAIPIFVLTVNAFWWLPGTWLASTKGESGFTFNHPEGVVRRLVQIVNSAGVESPIQSILIAAGVPGLFIIWKRGRAEGLALIGFCSAGLFWGYLAGAWRALDFLQPGRHTYALYSGLAIASGAALDELFHRLRTGPHGVDHLDRWVMAGLSLIGVRMVGHSLIQSVEGRLACALEVRSTEWWGWAVPDSIRVRTGPGEPFLSSRPSPRLLWVVDRVKRHVRPGERLLYEEGGFGADPFQRGRFSGLLPERTGVEVIGGPYLHASLQTNFTQFGEGKLFGRANWDRDHFVRYAKLYRPTAITCWSGHARRFCLDNPDLVKVYEDDGTVLIGRVVGFEGDCIEGAARIGASAGRIRVEEMSPGLDGSILLGYHSVPYLKASPPVAFEREYREDDPVPFIRLRPPAGTRSVELEMRLPAGR